jgi:hypothetical protein
LEVAAVKASHEDQAAARNLEEEAHRHQARAVKLAGDTNYAKKLRRSFDVKGTAVASSPARL